MSCPSLACRALKASRMTQFGLAAAPHWLMAAAPSVACWPPRPYCLTLATPMSASPCSKANLSGKLSQAGLRVLQPPAGAWPAFLNARSNQTERPNPPQIHASGCILYLFFQTMAVSALQACIDIGGVVLEEWYWRSGLAWPEGKPSNPCVPLTSAMRAQIPNPVLPYHRELHMPQVCCGDSTSPWTCLLCQHRVAHSGGLEEHLE